MEEALIGQRMRQILSDKIAMGMGYDNFDEMLEDEMQASEMDGEGYGTRRGALKGWATRRKRIAKPKVMRRKLGARKACCTKLKKRSVSKCTYGCPPSSRRGIRGRTRKSGSKRGGVVVSGKRRIGRGVGVGGVGVGGVGVGGNRKNKAAARRNPWLMHVAKFRRAHPGMLQSEIMKRARKTYHKK